MCVLFFVPQTNGIGLWNKSKHIIFFKGCKIIEASFQGILGQVFVCHDTVHCVLSVLCDLISDKKAKREVTIPKPDKQRLNWLSDLGHKIVGLAKLKGNSLKDICDRHSCCCYVSIQTEPFAHRQPVHRLTLFMSHLLLNSFNV